MGTHPIFESDFDCLTEKMVDPVLVIGAVVAALGIAAFGFLYFVSDSNDGYDAHAKERRELIGIKEPKGPKKEKQSKKKKNPKKAAKTEAPAKEAEIEEEAPEPEPVKAPEPVAEPEPEPVKPVKAAPEKKKAPAKAAPAAPAGLTIPNGKLSDEQAEDFIQTIIKRLNGRVPKGSKVTLASNVENLKKKLDEANGNAQRATAQLNEKISQMFDLEGQMSSSKAEVTSAKKA